MRLLHTKTLQFETFSEGSSFPYAILSHTWRNGEVTLADMLQQNDHDHHHRAAQSKAGFEKLQACCLQASLDGYDFVWIDTCCIDKTSSADLTESINSMFKWYRNAGVCYAFLDDVPSQVDPHQRRSPFWDSRWWKRGWTLQELLAPSNVHFFSSTWDKIATKVQLSGVMAEVKGIPQEALLGKDLHAFSIAKKMSWASGRETTLLEDEAYCLLGIFGINMPLLYGEGAKAFARLQEEIMKEESDQSIFAWGLKANRMRRENQLRGVLARSPAEFAEAGDVVPYIYGPATPFAMTNTGLQISLRFLAELGKDLDGHVHRAVHPNRRTEYAVLRCHRENRLADNLSIPLVELRNGQYARVGSDPPRATCGGGYSELLKDVYLLRNALKSRMNLWENQLIRCKACILSCAEVPIDGSHSLNLLEIVDTYPPDCWDKDTKIITVPPTQYQIESGWHAVILCNLANCGETDPFVLIVGCENNSDGPMSPWINAEGPPSQNTLRETWVQASRQRQREEKCHFPLRAFGPSCRGLIDIAHDAVMGPEFMRISFRVVGM
ncbi:MAG: hypothetical protein Q9160_003873 [Pyrenula sp. 1 TL-2023]